MSSMQVQSKFEPINFLITDIFVSLLIISFSACLDNGLIVASRRGVDVIVNDPQFSRLHVAEAMSIASAQSIYLMTGLLAPLTILCVDFCVRQSVFARSMRVRIVTLNAAAMK